MYDAPKVLLGLLVFVALFTAPMWMNIAGNASNDAPKLAYPTNSKECMAPKEYMKAYHMDMLDDWRDKVVRQDIRFMKHKGEKLEMSLTKTCMKCHDSKKEFCDGCHTYLGVSPYCWSCHIEPEKVKQGSLLKKQMLSQNQSDKQKEQLESTESQGVN